MSLEQLHKLKSALEKNGLDNNVIELMDFIKGAIESREYGKFIFTRNLSRAIQMIGKLGESCGISKDDFSYVNIKIIQNMYTGVRDMESVFKESVIAGKKDYNITKSVTLPPLILEPSDIWYFYYPDTGPNYITLDKAKGKAVVLKDGKTQQDIRDKILLIPSADPGYDWIFSHRIRGFITMYGGANSHMAIRAGELGIPAVIGIGEKQFNKYKTAVTLEIDCLAKIIRIIRKGI